MLETERIRTAFERNRKAATLRPSVGQGTAVTRVRMGQGFTCEVEDGKWKLLAGMSEKSGGDGAGPDPGVFGRAALGSCLAVGYLMWAAKAGVALERLEVEIQADYDVRGEYGIGGVRPGYSQIRYVVTIQSDAPEEEILAVLDEADKNSPYLRMFRDPQDVCRELRISRAQS